jgi:hypothetical protein
MLTHQREPTLHRGARLLHIAPSMPESTPAKPNKESRVPRRLSWLAIALLLTQTGWARYPLVVPPSLPVPGLVVSCVVEESADGLKIVDATEFPASEIESDRSTWNGLGQKTHRWKLLDRFNRTIDAGEIAVTYATHAPPDRGRVPVPLPPPVTVFIVRTPVPSSGQTIEISAEGRPVRPARWQRPSGTPTKPEPRP